jgi:phenylalanyl-tRNA synthetase beta subunit
MKSVELNNKAAYRTELKFFEFGSVFEKYGKVFTERNLLGMTISGSKESYHTLFTAVETMLRKLGAYKLTVSKITRSSSIP